MSDRLCDPARLVSGSSPSNTLRIEPPQAEAAASPQGGADSRADSSPRLVTRGETIGTPANAIIDWLSVTLPETAPVKMPELMVFLRDLLGLPELHGKSLAHGMSGFDNSVVLYLDANGVDTDVGRIAWGGKSQRGRTWLSLSGTLCARIKDWVAIAALLARWDARITRVDVAHDDFKGEVGLSQIEGKYRAGEFNSGGRQPNCSLAGDWLEVTGKGRTFYVGQRKNGKLLRIYEKGKQLGDPLSPWVRWEVEFKSKSRVIPYDILIDPARYLAGAYPALHFVAPVHERIKTQRKVACASLDRLTELAAISYGKTVNELRLQGLTAEEILSLLCRPGTPARMASPVASMPPGTQYFVGRNGDA